MKKPKKKKKLPTKSKRCVWIINPKTRRKGNDKAYNRKKVKARFRREMREEE